MKFLIVFALFVAVAVAAPVDDYKDAKILRYEAENIGVDGYKYAYETSDGKSAQEVGQLKVIDKDNQVMEVRGQFAYTAPDGAVYSVTYVANELGFQPEGAHIPK